MLFKIGKSTTTKILILELILCQYNPGKNILRKIPPSPKKVVEVGTWGKNVCLSQHCARRRGHFWNSVNLREILKYFFGHCSLSLYPLKTSERDRKTPVVWDGLISYNKVVRAQDSYIWVPCVWSHLHPQFHAWHLSINATCDFCKVPVTASDSYGNEAAARGTGWN